MNCLKYLNRKVDEHKYIPLQNLSSENVEHNIHGCFFYCRRKRHLIKNTKIKFIKISNDSIVLGDNEKLKYDYILNITTLNEHVLKINFMGNMNIHDGKLNNADNLITILIYFVDEKSREFTDELLKCIKKYKKLNIFDKSVFKFRTFKMFYKNKK